MKKILLLIVMGSLFFYCQKSFADDTKNIQWVTFISPLNDYSLKHPHDWIAGSLGKLYAILNSPANEQIKQNIKTKRMHSKGYMDDITIAYYSTGNNFAGYPTFEDWLKDENNPNRYISDVKRIKFAGTDAWEMIMTGSRTGYVIMIEHNGHLYQLGFNNRSSKTTLSEIDKKIIKSFKFID